MSLVTIRLRRSAAERYVRDLPKFAPLQFADLCDAIARAIKPKRGATNKAWAMLLNGAAAGTERKRKRIAKKAKAVETSKIRKAVFERSHGLCDYCQDAPVTDLEHPFGRGAGRPKQGAEVCLAVCRPCHRNRTDLVGGAVRWWSTIAAAFDRHGCSWARREAQRFGRNHEAKDALSVQAKAESTDV